MSDSMLAGPFVEIKDKELAVYRELTQLADAVGLKSLGEELRATATPKLAEERFSLVVVGEFNHGKSTFVNALLGAAILPVGITPTTATINHVSYSDKPQLKVHLTDGTSENLPPDDLLKWVTIDGGSAERVKFAELGWPAELLRDRVTLVDTPGVNDINEQRAEITYGYLPRADAVLFLLDGTQILKQSERSFLEQRILRHSRDRLLFIVGKADLLTPEEQRDAIAFCKTNLAKIVPDPAIFLVSSRRELSPDAGERAKSGFDELRQHLSEQLLNDRGRVLLDNVVTTQLRALSYLRQNLGIKRRSLSLPIAELDEKIARVNEQLETTRVKLRAHHQKIWSESLAIKGAARIDLDDFKKRLLDSLPAEIDKVDGADVKRYLQAFLAHIWQQWMENEGDRISELLERLAEEIITVTNDDVEATVAAMAREFGTHETKLDIEVDTLRYDVSVFALGALGTGVFLFVNALVGGILTLATPILAVILKDRVSGEMKKQAKQALPEVTQRIGESVQPKLDEIVDQFATRLADFVTAAGESLYRGIAEVLAETRKERQAAGADMQPQILHAEEQLTQLEAIQKRVIDLRDQLWASSTNSSDSPANSAT